MSGARELDLGAVAVTCTFNPGTLSVGGVALDVPPTLIMDEHYYEVRFDIPTNHPELSKVKVMMFANMCVAPSRPTQVSIAGAMTDNYFYWETSALLTGAYAATRFSLRALRVEVARQPTP